MKRLTLLAVCAVSVFAFAPARAENVTVGFGLSAFREVASNGIDTAASCRLSVAPGADGFDVLDAAVAQGCINSYNTAAYYDHSGNVYSRVGCIDGICDRDVYRPLPWPVLGFHAYSFWSSPVLQLFSASSGAEFVATYDFGVW